MEQQKGRYQKNRTQITLIKQIYTDFFLRMKNKPTFYGIGVGPGDPELLTLKALNILNSVDIIFAPKAKSKDDSLAREIVKNILDKKKEFIELEFPMTKDKEELEKRYKTSAEIILQKINSGNQVAYLTIGDPLLYSTYVYLLEALKEISPDLEIETIPGISAYSAVAARFSYSMAEKNEKICICPVPDDLNDLKKTILDHDTIVIMKVAKKLPEVVRLLQKMDIAQDAIFGSHVGMEGEKLVKGFANSTSLSEKEGYLSTIIVRKRKSTAIG